MTIGRYRLMEQIGEGGMGTIFVADKEFPDAAQGRDQGHFVAIESSACSPCWLSTTRAHTIWH